MRAAIDSDFSLVYTAKGKRAGTMSYAELGGAQAMGKCIISVNENTVKDNLIHSIASYNFSSLDEATMTINDKDFFRSYSTMKVRDKTKSSNECKNVLFCGDLENINKTILRANLGYKNIQLGRSAEEIYTNARFNDSDLIVVNFEKGWKPEGLLAMGIGYALKIPVLELEGNNIPYPPLMGLARRVLTGEKRFEQAREYIQNLKSQHISDEALVYYDLMKKFG